MSDYNEPFSVCFNILKMRYVDYDESLTAKDFLKDTSEKVNVFINLETVYKHLSMVKDLENRIITYRDFNEIMVSNILNLIAHYKRFFMNNDLDTKVYLYSTDFASNPTEFNQSKYNEFFRSYYLLKFNDNPKYSLFTERMLESVIPEVKICCEFIPDVYFVESKNIEGSLIPYIIAKETPERKNLIISGDLYDTQYSAIPNFVAHLIHRSVKSNFIHSSIDEYLCDIMKIRPEELQEMGDHFNSYTAYCSLLAALGDKARSIDGIYGLGAKKFNRYFVDGLREHVIQKETTSPELIGDIFHDQDTKEEFINNFYCSSVLPMYDELQESEIRSISSQLIDRSDINSLKYLNKTKYEEHPILLEGLIL